jgi:hypothetical protein
MKVPLQGISISQLSDGYTGKALDQALASVVQDINDRGDDGQARIVNVKLTFTPTGSGDDGQARIVNVKLTFTPTGSGRVDIDTQVTTKMPALHPPKTQAKLDGRSGGLIFNPDCSENPDQQTFNDLESEKSK